MAINVGLESSTQAQHGRRSVGDEGDASLLRPEVVSVGNVFTLFQFIKQIYRHMQRLRFSGAINVPIDVSAHAQ